MDESLISDQVAVDDGEIDDDIGQLNGDHINLSEEYIPLLNNWRQLLPGYRIRKATDATEASGLTAAVRRRAARRDRNKSPSPAGVKPTAAAKAAAASAARITGKDRSATGQAQTNRRQDKRTGIAA